MLPPRVCLVCRSPAADALCGLCRAALPWIFDACPRCALPRCDPCPAEGRAFDLAWAPVAHHGVARDLLLALKLRGAFGAADVMAAQMLARAPLDLGRAVLVPVPGHPGRTRRRGYDPAALIARALGRRTGARVFDALRRGGGPTRQLGRGRARRQERAPVALTRRPPPAEVAVLVDDVHTTGATLDACAEALSSAGFLQIAAVTYVRTLTDA